MLQSGVRGSHGVFNGMRGGIGKRRKGNPNDTASKLADYPCQCVLLLYLRRFVAKRRDNRLVYVAFTVFDPVYCELRNCSDNRRSLVRPGCPTKVIMNTNPSLSRS